MYIDELIQVGVHPNVFADPNVQRLWSNILHGLDGKKKIKDWNDIADAGVTASLSELCHLLLPSNPQFKEEHHMLHDIMSVLLKDHLAYDSDVYGIVDGIYSSPVKDALGKKSFLRRRRVSYSLLSKAFTWRFLPYVYVVSSLIACFILMRYVLPEPGKDAEGIMQTATWFVYSWFIIFALGVLESGNRKNSRVFISEMILLGGSFLLLVILIVIACTKPYYHINQWDCLRYIVAGGVYLLFGILALVFDGRFSLILNSNKEYNG